MSVRRTTKNTDQDTRLLSTENNVIGVRPGIANPFTKPTLMDTDQLFREYESVDFKVMNKRSPRSKSVPRTASKCYFGDSLRFLTGNSRVEKTSIPLVQSLTHRCTSPSSSEDDSDSSEFFTGSGITEAMEALGLVSTDAKRKTKTKKGGERGGKKGKGMKKTNIPKNMNSRRKRKDNIIIPGGDPMKVAEDNVEAALEKVKDRDEIRRNSQLINAKYENYRHQGIPIRISLLGKAFFAKMKAKNFSEQLTKLKKAIKYIYLNHYGNSRNMDEIWKEHNNAHQLFDYFVSGIKPQLFFLGPLFQSTVTERQMFDIGRQYVEAISDLDKISEKLKENPQMDDASDYTHKRRRRESQLMDVGSRYCQCEHPIPVSVATHSKTLSARDYCQCEHPRPAITSILNKYTDSMRKLRTMTENV